MKKYGHKSSDFFISNWKKGHPIDFFGPYNVVSTELTFFGPNMGIAVAGFS